MGCITSKSILSMMIVLLEPITMNNQPKMEFSNIILENMTINKKSEYNASGNPNNGSTNLDTNIFKSNTSFEFREEERAFIKEAFNQHFLLKDIPPIIMYN